MKRFAVLLTGLLSVAAVFAAAGDDALSRLSADESPEAGQRLTKLYHATKDPDQRIWLVQALALRLKDYSDSTALDPLLHAAQEKDPGVRGTALRALTVFDLLSREDIGAQQLAKIETVAKLGIDSPNGSVRDAAAELERSLKFFKNPNARDTPPPPVEGESERFGFWKGAAGLLKWVWIFLFPFVGGLWVWGGAPVFDYDGREGRFSAASFSALSDQYLFLGLCGFVWMNLAALVGGFGFYALAEILGRPLYSAPGSWVAFYLSAGFCTFLPASLAAAGFARRPAGSLFMSALHSLPWAFVFAFFALTVFAPLEIFYRLFFKRSERRMSESSGLSVLLGILDAGSFRSSHLAAAIAAREGRGVWPALEKAQKFIAEEGERRDFGLSGFDARFVLLCATPAMALLCSLVAKGMPVRWHVGWPVILLGCAVWAWGVLSIVLFALLQTLSGVDAAARVVRSGGGGLPGSFKELEAEYEREVDDEG